MHKIRLCGGPLDGQEIDSDDSMHSDFFVPVDSSRRARYHYNGNGTANHLGTETVKTDSIPVKEVVAAVAQAKDDKTPETPTPEAPPINLPKLGEGRLTETFYDDERHEVWIGVKLRSTIKAKLTAASPVTDVEVGLDLPSLFDEILAEHRNVRRFHTIDFQKWQKEMADKQALIGSGVLGRINDGLKKTFSKILH